MLGNWRGRIAYGHCRDSTHAGPGATGNAGPREQQRYVAHLAVTRYRSAFCRRFGFPIRNRVRILRKRRDAIADFAWRSHPAQEATRSGTNCLKDLETMSKKILGAYL